MLKEVFIHVDIVDTSDSTGRDKPSRNAGHSATAAAGQGDRDMSSATAALYTVLRRAYTTG